MHCSLKKPPRTRAYRTALFAATCCCALTFAAPLASSAQNATGPSKKPTIDFRTPSREYKTLQRGKWSFEVEQQLLDEAPTVASKALRRLQGNLDKAFRLLPKSSHPVLLEVKWYVLYGPKSRGGGHDNGLEYCARNARALPAES